MDEDQYVKLCMMEALLAQFGQQFHLKRQIEVLSERVKELEPKPEKPEPVGY